MKTTRHISISRIILLEWNTWQFCPHIYYPDFQRKCSKDFQTSPKFPKVVLKSFHQWLKMLEWLPIVAKDVLRFLKTAKISQRVKKTSTRHYHNGSQDLLVTNFYCYILWKLINQNQICMVFSKASIGSRHLWMKCKKLAYMYIHEIDVFYLQTWDIVWIGGLLTFLTTVRWKETNIQMHRTGLSA